MKAANQRIAEKAVGAYHVMGKGAVGAYKAIENSFVDAFLPEHKAAREAANAETETKEEPAKVSMDIDPFDDETGKTEE